MTPERKKNVEKFLERLLTKMDKGEKEHGEPLPLDQTFEEMQDEFLDIVGWGFVLWEKMEKLKKKVYETINS